MNNREKTSKICCVIVTYGNRWKLCKKVCLRALEVGVEEVVVVDNGSTERSSKELNQFCSETPSVQLVSNGENLGSSGGVARGLRAAFQLNSEFIWLLDDDNFPEEDSLFNLLEAHAFLKISFPEVVLYSSRATGRPHDSAAFTHGREKRYKPNSFCGFSFFDLLIWKLNRVTRPQEGEVNYPIARVHYGPYGGMFAKSSTFQKNGLPNEEYFVYADDHEYSNRFSTSKIPQFLIASSQLTDIDTNSSQASYIQSSNWYSEDNSIERLFYTVRNHTHLSKDFITCKAAYVFNMLVFLAYQSVRGCKDAIMSPTRLLKVNLTVWRAIRDGTHNRLGRNPLYQIGGSISLSEKRK